MQQPATSLGLGVEHSPVVTARCTEYEFEAVSAAVREMLDRLGGMSAFVLPGERIALKPNLLVGTAPERAITTHPAVVAAVASEVRRAGGCPVVVESPGAGVVHSRAMIDRVYRRTGIADAAEATGFELNEDMGWGPVSHPEGRLVRRMEVMKPIVEADGVINLAKFKTHTFMTFTGATKNLFGVIPGLNKVAFHGKLSDPLQFADMLLDVAGFVKPRLSIIDAVVGLEGRGPGTGGQPRALGFLMAGTDTVAMDVVCCRIGCIDTGSVPVLVAAKNRGMWSGRAADVDCVGVPVQELLVKDFVLPSRLDREAGLTNRLERAFRPFMRSSLSPLPCPNEQLCTRCGSCERACPTKAMTVGEKSAEIREKLCIRCYCCHELCPEAAIELKFQGAGRVMHRFGLV